MSSVAVLAVLTAIVAAVRSSWSPCGESVLSTITPVSEPGRGNRWRVTAGAFLVSSIIGGLATGSVAAALTPITSRAGTAPLLWLATVAAGVAAAVDWRSGGRGLPPRRRQLNEGDSSALRGWVYGSWWGLQVGCGVATICMTAAVYLTFVLASLSGEALVAVTTGAIFGLVRGLGVLPAGRLRDVQTLRGFHRRMNSFDDLSRRAAFVWLVTVTGTAVALGVGVGWVPASAAGVVAGLIAVRGSAHDRLGPSGSGPSRPLELSSRG